MAHAERTVLIQRPVESVFEFVLNGANNKLWKSSVSDVRPLTAAPYGAGSRFEQGLRGPTGRMAGDYEIVESRPHELIRFRVVAGPLHSTGAYQFEQRAQQTQVACALDYDPTGLSKAIDEAAAQQLFQEYLQANHAAGAVAFENLGTQERQVVLKISEGKSSREVARSLFIGEGTVRNYVYSSLSKVADALMQRRLDEEAGMLEELKAFLEKRA